jgi:hypothetical protein
MAYVLNHDTFETSEINTKGKVHIVMKEKKESKMKRGIWRESVRG